MQGIARLIVGLGSMDVAFQIHRDLQQVDKSN